VSDGNASPGTLAIDIYFDLVCPWCFIGKRLLAQATERFVQQMPDTAVELEWRPVQLLPWVPDAGLPFMEFQARRLGSADAVRQRQQQVVAAAARVGLDLDLARIARMPNTARAHALLRRVAVLEGASLHEALLERLFVAYFQRGEDIGDAATLRALALEVGVGAQWLAGAALGDPAQGSDELAISVPRFIFNGRRSVTGAQGAGVLLAAMHGVAPMPHPLDGACA